MNINLLYNQSKSSNHSWLKLFTTSAFSRLLLLAVLFSVSSLYAATITVQLRDNAGNVVPNASTATLQVYDGSWSTKTNDGFGNFSVTTSASTVIYRMSYNNGVQDKSLSTATSPVTFSTVTVSVDLQNCNNSILTGGTYQFYQNGWSGVKTANTSQELLPGNYIFEMSYHNGVQRKSGVAVSGSTQQVLYTTTSMTAALEDCNGNTLSGGTYQYYQNGWSGVKTANTSDEVLPGNYIVEMSFHNGVQRKSGVAVSGCTQEVLFTTTNLTAALKDCSNNTLTGGTYQYYQNGWSGVKTANTSDEVLPGNYIVEMSYHNGVQRKSGVAVSGCTQEVLFTTTSLTAALEDCSGNALSGGTYQYYQNGWSGVKTANTSDEVLPGNYIVEMSYNNGVQRLSSVAVSGCTSEALFTATKVIMNSSATIKHYQNGWGNYSNPKYLLPGNYIFSFNGANNTNVTVAGCSMTLRPVTVKLINSSGAPLSGGVAKYHTGAWTSIGTTGASGQLFVLINTTGSNAYFEMAYNNGKEQLYQNIVSNPVVTFQTKKVWVELRDHNNNLLSEATNLQYHQGAWNTFASGTTSGGKASMELLGGNYYFRLKYNNGAQEKYQNVGSNPTVTFTTKEVIVELRDHNNNLLSEATNLQYHQGAWNTFASGTTSGGQATMELLPGNYYFRLKYNNGAQEKYQNVGTNPTVTFTTNEVVVELRDHNGNLLSDASGVEYHQGAWNTFASGVTSGGQASMELLPGNYYFRLKYNNGAQEKYQNIGTTPTVTFTTKLVTMELRDHNGNLLGEGNNLKYHQGAWNTFGSGATTGGVETMELLPGNYYFRMGYSNASQEKYQNVGTTPTVTFTTTYVTLNLSNTTPAGISGGNASYHQGAWNTFGTTDASGNTSLELLPGNYYFRMAYLTYSKDKYTSVSGASQTVNFTYTGTGINRVANNNGKNPLVNIGNQNANANEAVANAEKANAVSTVSCYPNPTATTTTVNYTLASDQNVQVAVYSSNGTQVKLVVNEIQTAGTHSATVNAAELAGGIYYVHIVTPAGVQQVPVVVNK